MTLELSSNENTEICRVNQSGVLEDILVGAQKPTRYIGAEINMIRKDPSQVKLRVALAFPDAYEVGMSHLGLKVLYSIVNNRPELAAERVFAPWTDMERLMRSRNLTLCTLESGSPLRDFDLVGFSLQYELCAATVLMMLDLGRIPLRSKERTASDPLIIAGGPIAANPLPLSPFIDAFVIGDGEEVILEIADLLVDLKGRDDSRDARLRALHDVPGVYVPQLHETGRRVTRRVCVDLDKAPYPTAPIVPFCETVHDRVGFEVARGCTRGCRFCQAGILYRPVRERSIQCILSGIRESLKNTGWEEVSLLSLSTGDYSGIKSLVRRAAAEFGRDMVALSLPSLRTETLDEEVAEAIRSVRKTGFTLAPEAGTDRLRRVINKGNTEEDLERSVKTAFRQGWQGVKLYFMIGLPTEQDEDVDGIARLIAKASKWTRGGKLTASVSTFVPKPHTPFQWAEQLSMEETRRRQRLIGRFFRGGRVRVKFHDARTTYLEGILARGDQALADVIESAYRKGARFDGWEECFNLDRWMEAFAERGIDPDSYLREREA
ncbi:MAG: TIGR03960 family B12-binding radical SAM protein, partial [Pseudomonadota bacterium]